jgi:hypothetical protein
MENAQIYLQCPELSTTSPFPEQLADPVQHFMPSIVFENCAKNCGAYSVPRMREEKHL